MSFPDTLFKALDYVTTSRRALRLVFILLGIALALKFIFPQLSALVPMSNQQIGGISINVHFFISGALGMCSGALTFNLFEWLIRRAIIFRDNRELVKENLRHLELSAQRDEQKKKEFTESFRTAYPMLDNGCKLILNSLRRSPESLYPRDESTFYLKQNGWIEPTISLPNGYFIFKINKDISSTIDQMISEEIEEYSIAFINSHKAGCQKILELLKIRSSNSETSPLPYVEYVECWNEINHCFSITTGSSTITLSFRPSYHEKFESKLKIPISKQVTFNIIK
ncbi:hypothetical protein DAI21_10330 [Lelliottia sp. WB101]|uniref:hypothetical protein n=1 Tax=Lelliottia sp. WB101 TaxID=2153385 RepID=UPI000D22B5D7|nr:hypothetical protein [Lelliottia sp. WB101]AVY98029.1 hypothetical protein DAI21_10330 [Lelliottia sp. WB101]